MSDFISMTDWSWILGLVGLLVAFGIYGYVKGQPSGTEAMRGLSDQIHDGAMAFLKKEYSFLFSSSSSWPSSLDWRSAL